MREMKKLNKPNFLRSIFICFIKKEFFKNICTRKSVKFNGNQNKKHVCEAVEAEQKTRSRKDNGVVKEISNQN